jgi:hypothetical protein
MRLERSWNDNVDGGPRVPARGVDLEHLVVEELLAYNAREGKLSECAFHTLAVTN